MQHVEVGGSLGKKTVYLLGVDARMSIFDNFVDASINTHVLDKESLSEVVDSGSKFNF
jgi:hypothetical protein